MLHLTGRGGDTICKNTHFRVITDFQDITREGRTLIPLYAKPSQVLQHRIFRLSRRAGLVCVLNPVHKL